MTTDKLFIPVPVSDPPKEEGFYAVIDPQRKGVTQLLYFIMGDWFDNEQEQLQNVDGCFWLKPISLQDHPKYKELKGENERLKANANETSYKR